MFKRLTLAIAAVILVSACASTRPIELQYMAPAQSANFESANAISLGNVADERGNGANWIGAIRGGYGNPLKVLETDKPVKDIVADLVSEGLEARGVTNAYQAPYRLDVTIVRFESSQYVRREAHAQLKGDVVNTETGEVVYTGLGTADNVNGSVLAMNTGIFADPEELRSIANQTLQQAIDELLDDPKLHDALKG
ncbi:MAG TPA: YajG family lipoprotein [Hyphomonas sp.]|nr:YajG family lipoprotein [Hyphomonas sp.]